MSRGRNYLTQVSASAIFKAVSTASSVLYIPIILSQLHAEQFGVWTGLLSIISWIAFLDIGINNGLQTILSKYIAADRITDAREVLGAGFVLISIISCAAFVIATVVFQFIPWQYVLNTTLKTDAEFSMLASEAAFFTLTNLAIGQISALAAAKQKTSFIAFSQGLLNLALLLLTMAFAHVSELTLKEMPLIYGASQTLSSVALLFVVLRKYSSFSPIFVFSLRRFGEILTPGKYFFATNIAVLFLFSTDKILMLHYFGPKAASHYEVLSRLFGFLTMFHNGISNPLWPAYADAIHRRDFGWVEKMILHQAKIFFVFLSAAFLLAIFCKEILAFWVGGIRVSNPILIYAVATVTGLGAWNRMFAMVVNGSGEIRSQAAVGVIAAIINMCIALLLISSGFLGEASIPIATALALLPTAVVLPTQAYNIVRLNG